jgi:hypothetical protein
MFQYAFAKRLESIHPGEVRIDISSYGYDPAHNGFELSRLFEASIPEAEAEHTRRLSVPPLGILNRLRRKYLTKPSHVIDRLFRYQPELMDLPGDRYFDGYWQSEKYFAPIGEALRREFTFKLPLAARNLEALDSLPRPVASVHVRRGDFLKYPNLAICTPAYYARAVASAQEHGAKSIMLFSDEMDYCRDNLELGNLPSASIDWNRGAESWQDMAMMSRCDLHVIANSSFSWWGAWLDPRPGKTVIAPTPWNRRELRDSDHYYAYTFEDIVPEAWERIPV